MSEEKLKPKEKRSTRRNTNESWNAEIQVINREFNKRYGGKCPFEGSITVEMLYEMFSKRLLEDIKDSL